MTSATRKVLGLAGLLLVVVLLWWSQSSGSDDAGVSGPAGSPGASSSVVAPDLPTFDDVGIPFADLPPEGQRVVEQIQAGGPYSYAKDGSTFGNRERLLPLMPRGYYREFTVPTPGSADRGARRIIAGDGGELYYTADHYQSFERIGPRS